jgi:hypothetical protein
MYYKLICILYALLCGQNFILVKSGCYRGGGANHRGRLFSPPPHPLPLHPLLRTLTQKGSPPPCHCGTPGNAFEPFFLFSCTLHFIFGAVSLPPHHILKQGDPLQVATHTSKTLQHERTRHQKRQKLTQSSRNTPERTHPGADDPVPQENQARARVSIYSESNDPSDPGIDLCICQLG